MRKHRLFGVVIAVLTLGVFIQRSDNPHPTSGTTRVGSPLASSALSSDRVTTGASAPVNSVTSTQSPQALASLVTGHAVTILSAPFGPQAVVADTHIALMNQRVVTTAYLSAVAQHQAVVKAYLQAVAPPPPAPVVRSAPAAVTGDPWAALRQCESGGNYGEDSGNGYYGAYQFNPGTWHSLGLPGLPSQASAAQQDQAAQELQARRGWGQWPACSRRLGL
jgi:hypothetical protein